MLFAQDNKVLDDPDFKEKGKVVAEKWGPLQGLLDVNMADYRQLVTGSSASERRERREADKASKADRRREAPTF